MRCPFLTSCKPRHGKMGYKSPSLSSSSSLAPSLHLSTIHLPPPGGEAVFLLLKQIFEGIPCFQRDGYSLVMVGAE